MAVLLLSRFSDSQQSEYIIPVVADGLEKLLKAEEKLAYYYVKETVSSFKEYECM